MKEKKKHHKQPVRKGHQPLNKLQGNNSLYAGIAALLLVIIFGKVIAVSLILMSVGWIAGKIVKRIDKRRAS